MLIKYDLAQNQLEWISLMSEGLFCGAKNEFNPFSFQAF